MSLEDYRTGARQVWIGLLTQALSNLRPGLSHDATEWVFERADIVSAVIDLCKECGVEERDSIAGSIRQCKRALVLKRATYGSADRRLKTVG